MVCVEIRVAAFEHALSYSLGWLEAVNYPKDRMRINVLIDEGSSQGEGVDL